MALTINTNDTRNIRPTTQLGEAIEQIHDHRIDSNHETRLLFCPSGVHINPEAARRVKVPNPRI